jgi:myo-inositol-1(or 4)-monophosphatase
MGAETTPDQLSPPSPGELLSLASDLAGAAGDVLRSRPADLGVTTKSSPTDVVTVMDRAAEQVIVDGLSRARPQDAITSEESAARAGSSGVRWLVDPLDGTVNYLYGIPQYAVSIAAEVQGEMCAGVVLDVARGIEYAATRGGGATAAGKPIRCSSQTDPGQSLVATGFSYDVAIRAAQAVSLHSVLPAVRDIRRFGAAALDLCAVACGEVDAFYEAVLHEWDWAAGALIAREAGAKVAGLHGRPPGRRTTLAANPQLFEALQDVLAASGADELPVVGDGRTSSG